MTHNPMVKSFIWSLHHWLDVIIVNTIKIFTTYLKLSNPFLFFNLECLTCVRVTPVSGGSTPGRPLIVRCICCLWIGLSKPFLSTKLCFFFLQFWKLKLTYSCSHIHILAELGSGEPGHILLLHYQKYCFNGLVLALGGSQDDAVHMAMLLHCWNWWEPVV